MKKIIYIGFNIEKVGNGADAINLRNIKLLKSIFGDNISFVHPTGGSVWKNLFFGISRSVLKTIDLLLMDGSINHIFIAQSLYGRAAKYIKGKYPSIKVITFCHNIEVDYAKSYLKSSGIKAFPFYLAVKIWERAAINNSDKIITLNKRDSNRLKKLYHVTSSCELPTSFDDVFDVIHASSFINGNLPPVDYLFVGMAFFPNIQGVQWFIDNIINNVEGHFYVVGKGMDKVNFKNLNNRIHILGYVDDLSEYYYRAKLVVSPIFTGAGMKTKTAEALMYGKTIIGTSEAFEGYKIDTRCMMVANTKIEFIEIINKLRTVDRSISCKSARDLFLTNYETKVLKNIIKGVFYDNLKS